MPVRFYLFADTCREQPIRPPDTFFHLVRSTTGVRDAVDGVLGAPGCEISCDPDMDEAALRQTLRVVGFGRATADAVDQTWSGYRTLFPLRGATTPHRAERVGIQTP